MKTSFYKYLFILSIIASGCSREKNTFTSRSFHNITSHYNIYFNGYESFNRGVSKTEDNYQDNYSRILPLFYFSSPDVAQSVAPDMQRSLEKSTKVITLHSISAKPELKKGPQSDKQKAFYSQKEFNKWIDDNFVLMGKAYVYKNEFYLAIETFKKVIRDFPNEDSKYEALIWMARAYNEQKEYREAEKILNNLVIDEDLPKKLLGDLYTTFADLYIKQDNHEKAIQHLTEALENTKSKHYRIRYNYILAQLYQKENRSVEAIKSYKKVIKMNPPYEMTFNAKINMAGSFEVGSGKGKEFQSLLEKMLKDDKNIEFQDQIYYALGNISMKQSRQQEAIDYFKQSAQASVENFNQKGLSYLAIGDIYYSKPDYTLSQAYYDSCLQNIDQQYEDYEELSSKSRSLTHLVFPLNIFELEDSLQNLAAMPQEQLYAIVDEIIAEVAKKEEEERLRKQQESEERQYGMSMGNQSQRTQTDQGGKWYFYNMIAKGFGQPEFRMLWGNRRLEDDWRRSNKQSIEIIDADIEGEVIDSADTEQNTVLNNRNREFYLQNIPFSDSALEQSNIRLEKALYNMGLVYRDELNDKEESIFAFQEGLKRYPVGDFAVLSAFSLYEIYNIGGPLDRANYYKNYIIENFPDTPRAKILSNPEYVEELLKEQNRVNEFYEESYNLFNAGSYARVISNVDYALVEFAGDENIPRFLLIRALSIGRIESKNKLTDELQKIVDSYPGNEIANFAANLIKHVYEESPEVAIADIQEEAAEIYTYSETNGAYFFGLATSTSTLNQMNFNIINFNLDNFNNYNFGIQQEEIGDQTVIFIKDFTSYEMISNYFATILDHEEEVFKDVNREEVQVFFISDQNYIVLKEDTDIRKYYLYFKKFY